MVRPAASRLATSHKQCFLPGLAAKSGLRRFLRRPHDHREPRQDQRHAGEPQRAERLAEAVAATLQSVTKLRGEVKLVAPGTLPNDGKVIADERGA